MACDPRDVRYPSIDGLRAFECAARLGSFERAAAELAVTPSAIGKRIATLEALLGTPLLVRAPRQLALTPAGKEYLAQVGAALDLLQAVPLHRRPARRTERLRIVAPPTFARQVLVPHLEEFTRAQPGIELEVLLSIPYLAGDGDDGTAGVEIRFGKVDAARHTLLMQERVLAMASPSLIGRTGPLRTPSDLDRAPLLRAPLEPWTPWLRAAGLAWPEPADGPRLVDLGMTLEAAVSGQGVVLARPSLARAWLASGALRPLFDVASLPASQYHLLPHAADGPAGPFGDWLHALCGRLAREAMAEALEILSGAA